MSSPWTSEDRRWEEDDGLYASIVRNTLVKVGLRVKTILKNKAGYLFVMRKVVVENDTKILDIYFSKKFPTHTHIQWKLSESKGEIRTPQLKLLVLIPFPYYKWKIRNIILMFEQHNQFELIDIKSIFLRKQILLCARHKSLSNLYAFIFSGISETSLGIGEPLKTSSRLVLRCDKWSKGDEG